MNTGRILTICAVLSLAASAQILCAEDASKILSEKKIGAAEFLKSKDAEAEALEKSARLFYAEKNFELAGEFSALSKIFSAEGANSMSEDLKIFFVENPNFAEEFSQTLSSDDNSKNVFDILSKIWADNPDAFRQYPRLAAAISVVFDTPPPAEWPHHQVSEKVLKRELGDPVEAFKKRLDKSARPLISPDKLSIEEAKYLVSSLASDADAAWVKKSIAVNIPNIAKLYPTINYDTSRLNGKRFDWEGSDYSLETIKKRGGICVDQAYYTAEVAKTRGVPAFILSGAGSDGFHAWTAYMLKSGNWNFGVGRYEGARFVTGHTLDPQTWKPASDHALNSMRERFRDGEKYKTNLLHTLFAKKILEAGDAKSAILAARNAIMCDGRNTESWDILSEAQKKSGAKEADLRKTYEAAAKAFGRYPDIEAVYRKKQISTFGENERDAAQKISGAMIIKTKKNRPDIAMEFARSDLENDIVSGNIERLSSSYKRLLTVFKSDAAVAVNGITIPILNKLLSEKKFEETREILKLTRQVLKGSKDQSLTSSLDNIETQLVGIEAKYKKN